MKKSVRRNKKKAILEISEEVIARVLMRGLRIGKSCNFKKFHGTGRLVKKGEMPNVTCRCKN